MSNISIHLETHHERSKNCACLTYQYVVAVPHLSEKVLRPSTSFSHAALEAATAFPRYSSFRLPMSVSIEWFLSVWLRITAMSKEFRVINHCQIVRSVALWNLSQSIPLVVKNVQFLKNIQTEEAMLSIGRGFLKNLVVYTVRLSCSSQYHCNCSKTALCADPLPVRQGITKSYRETSTFFYL